MQNSRLSRLRSFLGVVLLIIPIAKIVVADDLFNFANFANPSEWNSIYKTCSRTLRDTFREPRTELRPDDLRAPFESLGPVPINVTEPSQEERNKTLHIYSNPGVRNSYSVSYGFKRNKECLHGQDGECVVSPDFGRVRALVVNADRFKTGQNLNYIKDHFLIEETEKFVTILNGGSIYERKFYEAVFLGGYPKKRDPTRSSHTIHGKSFPLEIYMYFVDETVPSMTLTTILVVLVEESRKDNPHIKPIINTVKKKLYDAERQFIESNRNLLRTERLYHNLRESLQHNLFKEDIFALDEKESTKFKEETFQKSLAPTTVQEGDYSDYYESFERLQALSAELQFHDEDLDQIDELIKDKRKEVFAQLDFADDKLPHAHEYFVCAEQMFIAQVAFIYNAKWNYLLTPAVVAALLVANPNSNPEPNVDGLSIDAVIDEVLKSPPWGNDKQKLYADCHPDPAVTADAHFTITKELAKKLTEHLEHMIYDRDKYTNQNFSRFDLATLWRKYETIKDFRTHYNERDELNDQIYKHFHEDTQYHLPELREDFSLYKHGKRTALQMFQNIDRLYELHFKEKPLKDSREVLQRKVDDIWNKYSFPDETVMRDVIRYLKYGEKDLNVQIIRSRVHDQIWDLTLPMHEKRRGFVEQKNMGMAEPDIKAANVRDPITIPVDQAFQISWLMPPHGGYYYYSGSSPLPPCFRAQNVIVFKTPISMSKDQITWLTKIPVSMNRRRDIPNTTPKLWPLKFEVSLSAIGVERAEEVSVKVYSQNRNHIFLGSDGVHKNAIEVMEKRRADREGSGSESCFAKAFIVLIFAGINTFVQNHFNID